MKVVRGADAGWDSVGHGFLRTCFRLTSKGEVVVGSLVLPPGGRVPAEGSGVHSQDEVSVVVKGRLYVEATGETAILGPGDGCHIPHGQAHWCQNQGPDEVELVWILVDVISTGG